MTVYKQEEINLCGKFCKVDIVADAADLPFKDKTFDFVISSHMLEHHWDPIKVVREWVRVAKEYIFITVPRMDLTFDKDKDLTSIEELVNRHLGIKKKVDESIADDHWTIWGVENFKDFCFYLCGQYKLEIVVFQEVDDKVGNGMTVLFKIINYKVWREEETVNEDLAKSQSTTTDEAGNDTLLRSVEPGIVETGGARYEDEAGNDITAYKMRSMPIDPSLIEPKNNNYPGPTNL